MSALTLVFILFYSTSVALIVQHETPPELCDFNATILPKQRYSFANENWPDTYDMGVRCRWTFNCIEGYACRLRCLDVGLPATLGCHMDKLLVSTTSDKTFGARVFCGRDIINVRSFGTKITMKLITSQLSPGGRFRCVVHSEKWKYAWNHPTVLPLSMKLDRIKNNMNKSAVTTKL